MNTPGGGGGGGDSIRAYDLADRVQRYDADMEIMHPNRRRMVDVMLELLPFDPAEPLSAVELGVGTGFLTGRFLDAFPRSSVIGIDGANQMVELARERLGPRAERVDFRIGDFRDLDRLLAGRERGLVVMTSYALHHLLPAEKEAVLRRGLAFLESGGWLLNADVITGESPVLERRLQTLRVEGCIRRGDGDHRFADTTTTRRYLDELEANEGDKPLPLSRELDLLRAAGLANPNAFWVEYREAVMGGVVGSTGPVAPPAVG